jgi:hypothetical protein
MNEFIESIPYITLGVGSSYVIGLALADFLPNKFSKKITSKRELEKIAFEEAKKMDIDTKYLICELVEQSEGRASVIGYYPHSPENQRFGIYDPTNENMKKVSILRVGGLQATKYQTVHELCHLKNDFNNPKKNKIYEGIKYLFLKEPRAILHGLKSLF